MLPAVESENPDGRPSPSTEYVNWCVPGRVSCLQTPTSPGDHDTLERLERLARDLLVQETIIGDLQKRGFQLISVTEPDLVGRRECDGQLCVGSAYGGSGAGRYGGRRIRFAECVSAAPATGV